MALETASYISGLNADNPAETDGLNQADDHLKLIKSTLKASFPNVNAAVTQTPAELNKRTALEWDGTNVTYNTGMTESKLKTLANIQEPAIVAQDDGTPAFSSGITAAEIKELLSISMLGAYPVGAIYTSAVSTTPATLFGGTWVPFGQGKVMVGHDTSDTPDTDFVAGSTDGVVLKTGGQKTYTLLEDNIPPHSHEVLTRAQNRVELFSDAQTTIREFRDSSFGGDSTVETTDNTETTGSYPVSGSTDPFGIVQPYVVVYMWQRTV